LLGLGPRQYLEIIAPDPQQAGSPASREPWAARLIALQEPRLIGWAAHTNDLAAIAKMAAAAGIAIEEPRDGSRARTDGALLRWKSFSLKDDRDGLLPFFIEWNRESIHPSQEAPVGCKLLHFAAESPSAAQLVSDAQKLDLDFDVKSGERSRFHARILGTKGEFELT
jgi:Glyoxalase-like domain